MSQHQRNHPEQLRKSVRTAKKTPCNHLPFWHNMSQCIKTGMGYCSKINTFNLYLKKLFWKTRILELPNFSRRKTFSPSDNKKNKKQNPPTQLKNAASPNYKMRQRMSSSHNTALEVRRPAGSIHRRLKFLIKVICILSHNSSTGTTQLAPVILQVQEL